MKKKEFIDNLTSAWDAPYVARAETKKFTGGGISSRSVANLESADPDNRVLGRFVLGRRVMYPKKNYAIWLADRLLKNVG